MGRENVDWCWKGRPVTDPRMRGRIKHARKQEENMMSEDCEDAMCFAPKRVNSHAAEIGIENEKHLKR